MIKDTRKMENTLTQSLYANPSAFAILEAAAQGSANCCSPNSEPQAPSSFLKTPLSLSPDPQSLFPFVKMVTGMDIDSGMSYITYKPYGEINRTNSSGPDIYRYKYTAQEDGRVLQSLSGGQNAGLQQIPSLRGASYASRVDELGLYYYKARWYVRSPRQPKAKGTEACKAARRAEGGGYTGGFHH